MEIILYLRFRATKSQPFALLKPATDKIFTFYLHLKESEWKKWQCYQRVHFFKDYFAFLFYCLSDLNHIKEKFN